MANKIKNDETRVFRARDQLRREQPSFERTYQLFLASYRQYVDMLGSHAKDQPKAASCSQFVTE